MTTRPPDLAAVLWDLDGTLVDTEPYWIAAEYALVESHGGTWSDHHAHTIVGSSLLAAAAYIKEHGSVPLDPPVIVEQLLASVIARVREHTPWRPGAQALLSALVADGVPCALVTMSYRNLAMAAVDQLPAGSFSVVVTGDSVTHGKPHPEPYLVAAEQLGVDPAACIALEDSPTGVASAEAAGCVTIAIPHVAHVEATPGRIFARSMQELTVDGLRELVRGRSSSATASGA